MRGASFSARPMARKKVAEMIGNVEPDQYAGRYDIAKGLNIHR